MSSAGTGVYANHRNSSVGVELVGEGTHARRGVAIPGGHPEQKAIPLAAADAVEETERVLSFAVERDGDCARVNCRGRLIADSTEELLLAVKQLLPRTKLVVIDLAELTYIDRSGLGTMMQLRASARKVGCHCKLAHLGKQVRNVVRLRNVLFAFSQVEEHGITIA